MEVLGWKNKERKKQDKIKTKEVELCLGVTLITSRLTLGLKGGPIDTKELVA